MVGLDDPRSYHCGQYCAEMLKINPEVTYGDFIACDRFDRMKEVEGIHCPTLILCGADDRLTPPKYSQYLHERIPRFKVGCDSGCWA